MRVDYFVVPHIDRFKVNKVIHYYIRLFVAN